MTDFYKTLERVVPAPFITLENGTAIALQVAATYMDDEIREALHTDFSPCSAQEFFDAYVKAHQVKFNEDFVIN